MISTTAQLSLNQQQPDRDSKDLMPSNNGDSVSNSATTVGVTEDATSVDITRKKSRWGVSTDMDSGQDPALIPAVEHPTITNAPNILAPPDDNVTEAEVDDSFFGPTLPPPVQCKCLPVLF